MSRPSSSAPASTDSPIFMLGLRDAGSDLALTAACSPLIVPGALLVVPPPPRMLLSGFPFAALLLAPVAGPMALPDVLGFEPPGPVTPGPVPPGPVAPGPV